MISSVIAAAGDFTSDPMSYIMGPQGALVLALIVLWWIAKGLTAIVKWAGNKLDLWVASAIEQVTRITNQNAELIEEGKQDRLLFQEQSKNSLELYRNSIEDLVEQFKIQSEDSSEKLDEILKELKSK